MAEHIGTVLMNIVEAVNNADITAKELVKQFQTNNQHVQLEIDPEQWVSRQEFEQLKETVLRLEKEVRDLHDLVVHNNADAYNNILGVCK